MVPCNALLYTQGGNFTVILRDFLYPISPFLVPLLLRSSNWALSPGQPICCVLVFFFPSVTVLGWAPIIPGLKYCTSWCSGLLFPVSPNPSFLYCQNDFSKVQSSSWPSLLEPLWLLLLAPRKSLNNLPWCNEAVPSWAPAFFPGLGPHLCIPNHDFTPS